MIIRACSDGPLIVPGISCPYTACQEGHLEVVKYLSETWGRELVMMACSDGISCLHTACYNGQLEVVKYLSETWGR